MKIGFLLVAAIVIFALWVSLSRKQRSHFGDDDENYALAALQDLDDKLYLNNRYTDGVPEVDDYYLSQNAHNIHLIKEPDVPPKKDDGKEHLSFIGNPPVNTSYWPYYYYTAPYQNADTGAWPPNMQSRLYNWQPGFASGSGWSYWVRPGIAYSKWARNRWLKNGGKYYFINNGDSEQDRIRDYTGEPS